MTSLFVRFYEAIIRAGESFSSYLLLAMRLFWGYQLYQSGMGKFSNIPKVVQFFQNLGIPFADTNANIAASIEIGGGILLMIGLASRLVSIPIACVMCTAYVTAHRPALLNIFQDPDTFLTQAPFLFLLTALVVFSFGPGKFSLDYLLERKQ